MRRRHETPSKKAALRALFQSQCDANEQYELARKRGLMVETLFQVETVKVYWLNGPKLRQLREPKSLRETAKRLRISPTYLSRLETAERTRISHALYGRIIDWRIEELASSDQA